LTQETLTNAARRLRELEVQFNSEGPRFVVKEATNTK
jgi:hypothetical protein